MEAGTETPDLAPDFVQAREPRISEKSPLHDGQQAKYGAVQPTPATLKVKKPDGTVDSYFIAKKSATICCMPPAGGWYGPFGFFRLLAYAWFVMMGIGIILAIILGAQLDVHGAVGAILLVAAAEIAALAALSHEGLCREVTQISRQNDKYAALNKKLSSQIKELAGTRKRLDAAAGGLQEDLDNLNNVLTGIERCNSIWQANGIVRSFISADQYGDRNRRLSGRAELADFFDTSGPLLKTNAPDFDLDLFKELASIHGIGMCITTCIIAMLDCEENAAGQHRSQALGMFIIFALQPDDEDQQQQVIEQIQPPLAKHNGGKYEPRTKLQTIIQSLVDAAGDGRIPENMLRPLKQDLVAVEPEYW